MLDRKIAPAFTLPDSVHLIEAESFLLPNKSSFHLINAGEQDVIRLEIIFKAGSKYETLKGSSYFASKMLSEGTSKYSSKQITEYLDLFGAFNEIQHGADKTNFTFYFLTKYLKDIGPFIRELITDSIFPEDELNNNKNITLQNIKVNLKKTSYLASIHFKEQIFGKEHPYGKFLKEEDIGKINQEKTKDFYNTYIKSTPFDIVVSGNLKSLQSKELQDIFGTINQSLPNEPRLSYQLIQNNEDIFFLNKEDSVQSSIRLGNITIKKNHPDYFNLVILNEIFGGYFGSRLMKNIREEKGFTYGISSSIVHLDDFSYLVIGTDVKKENTQQTLDEIQKEINILKSSLVDTEELETVKNYLIGTFLSSINTPFALADKFKSIYYFNLDYSFYSSYLKAIEKSDSQKLIEVANKYFDFDRMTKVIVGGIQ